MIRSVRRTAADWLERGCNRVTQKLVQVLRGADVHAESSRHNGARLVVSVDHSRCQPNVNDGVVVPYLGDHVDIVNRHTVVSQLPEIGANGNFPASAYHNFIGHQGGLHQLDNQFNAQLASLNAKAAGVES